MAKKGMGHQGKIWLLTAIKKQIDKLIKANTKQGKTRQKSSQFDTINTNTKQNTTNHDHKRPLMSKTPTKTP